MEEFLPSIEQLLDDGPGMGAGALPLGLKRNAFSVPSRLGDLSTFGSGFDLAPVPEAEPWADEDLGLDSDTGLPDMTSMADGGMITCGPLPTTSGTTASGGGPAGPASMQAPIGGLDAMLGMPEDGPLLLGVPRMMPAMGGAMQGALLPGPLDAMVPGVGSTPGSSGVSGGDPPIAPSVAASGASEGLSKQQPQAYAALASVTGSMCLPMAHPPPPQQQLLPVAAPAARRGRSGGLQAPASVPDAGPPCQQLGLGLASASSGPESGPVLPGQQQPQQSQSPPGSSARPAGMRRSQSYIELGHVSPGERAAKLERYRQKRDRRNFQKRVTYQVRQNLADKRKRVGGRFAKEAAAPREPDSD